MHRPIWMIVHASELNFGGAFDPRNCEAQVRHTRSNFSAYGRVAMSLVSCWAIRIATHELKFSEERLTTTNSTASQLTLFRCQPNLWHGE